MIALSPGGIRRYGPAMPTKQDILDLHFMGARCQLIDLAAFLDRVARHPGETDHRLDAFIKAIPILLEDRPDRARAVLEAFSDPTTRPADKATTQTASGAPAP